MTPSLLFVECFCGTLVILTIVNDQYRYGSASARWNLIDIMETPAVSD